MKKLTKKQREQRGNLFLKILINLLIMYIAIDLFVVKQIFVKLIKVLMIYYHEGTAVLFTLLVAYGFYKMFMWLIDYTNKLFSPITKIEKEISELKKEYNKSDKEKTKELYKKIKILKLKEKMNEVKNG